MFSSKYMSRALLRLSRVSHCRQAILRSEACLSSSVVGTSQTHLTRTDGDSFQGMMSPYSMSRYPLMSRGHRRVHTSTYFLDDVKIISTPPFAESVTEGNIKWLKAAGDAVAEDEVVGEIETDKTALPVTAPSSGVIEELLVEDDARVEKGDQLFKLRIGGEASPEATKAASPEAPAQAKADASPPPPPPPPAPSADAPIQASHPPSELPPVPSPRTSPVNIVKPSGVPQPPVSQLTTQKEAKDGPTTLSGTRTETRVKMTRMRQRIASRLKDSQNVNAMLTTFNEVDMSNVMQMRSQHKEAFLKKHGLKLGFMSAFVKAAGNALQAMPTVNAVIDQDAVVYRDYVDISVAVATPKGLVVPVLRDVQHLDFAGIEHGINALGVKARDGNLAIEDMEGGTFTISNGGVFGSLMGTPIINPPQSAILGMHAIFDRPVAVDGKVEIRPMMYIALTYDHRLIDGREAVTFLKRIKSAVEDPRVLLLNV